jgi:maltooligosyltrehalose trehalohydrolase
MRTPMTAAGGGWWAAGGAEAGARYGFSLEGGEVRPDPRSNHQPDGVLGLSQVVDHASFDWHDGGWKGSGLAGSVIYELHVGTFTLEGTFDAAAGRLGHLAGLGLTAVELMPVAEFDGDRGWGYDGAALFAPHHSYGGPDALKRLVDACHAAGLAAVLDVVYNHLGPVGNFLAEFGPYFSDRYHTAWGAALNYDGHGCDEVRRFVVDNALMWIRDYHFDGLRLDAVHAILDRSPVHILEQLAAEVHATKPGAFLIAESSANDPRLVRSVAEGGYGLDGVWSDDWHHALQALMTGDRGGYYLDFGSAVQLEKALRQAWVYEGEPSRFWGRSRGRTAAGVPSDRFVIATQNHDQVGNRAAGERLSALVDEPRLRMAAALLLTSPFTPMLFQGEEWAAGTPFQYFTSFADVALGRAVGDGRRREFAEFGWDPERVPDPQDPRTFERSKLDWSEPAIAPHLGMREWYRALLTLRRRLPVDTAPVGEGVVARIDGERRLTFERPGLSLSANLGEAAWDVDVPAGFALALASPDVERAGAGLRLPPFGVAIFEGETDV